MRRDGIADSDSFVVSGCDDLVRSTRFDSVLLEVLAKLATLASSKRVSVQKSIHHVVQNCTLAPSYLATASLAVLCF